MDVSDINQTVQLMTGSLIFQFHGSLSLPFATWLRFHFQSSYHLIGYFSLFKNFYLPRHSFSMNVERTISGFWFPRTHNRREDEIDYNSIWSSSNWGRRMHLSIFR